LLPFHLAAYDILFPERIGGMNTMTVTSLRDGVCPQCGKRAVHANTHFREWFGDNTVPLGGMAFPLNGVKFDRYVCTECGYSEQWCSDRAKLQRIAELWPLVGDPQS
jgi:predicted RNA-binding Zn-ribbon protein involved in translation (DUF1610 family)